jgi:hypothetical protein
MITFDVTLPPYCQAYMIKHDDITKHTSKVLEYIHSVIGDNCKAVYHFHYDDGSSNKAIIRFINRYTVEFRYNDGLLQTHHLNNHE